jgi:hypothetical protein
MPVITGVQGYTGLTKQTRLCLETGTSPGESLLMPLTTGASTMSLTTQPNTISATSGMHLHFYIIGNATAGNIVIVGTKADGVTAQTSLTYHVPIAPQNNQGYTDFTTKETWGTVTASSITLTTLTPCQVMVFGSFGGKYLLPITSDYEEKIGHFSPQDKRGILAKNLRVQQLTTAADVTKLDCSLYPDSLWAYYMLIGNTPVVTTQPTSATSKLASTAIAATMTLTTGPASPGEFLIFAITTNTASGTIVVNGTDQYGTAYSAAETITFTSAATQTVYSQRKYSVVNTSGANTFTTTGGTSAHIVVTGVFAYTYTWTYDGINNTTPYSATIEDFNGVWGTVLPGTVLSDGTWTWDKAKEIAFTAKGTAQDYQIVGDESPTSAANYLSGTNPFPTLAQPTSLPVVSWPASFYIDSLPSSSPFTTQDGSFLSLKIGVMTGRKWVFSGDGQQRASFVTWDTEPDFTVDGTLLVQNYQYYNQYFVSNQKYVIGAQFQGNLLGKDSSSTYYENIQWTLPVKFDTAHIDASKNPVEIAFKEISEYDFGLGYYYKCAVTCQQPPTYPN